MSTSGKSFGLSKFAFEGKGGFLNYIKSNSFGKNVMPTETEKANGVIAYPEKKQFWEDIAANNVAENDTGNVVENDTERSWAELLAIISGPEVNVNGSYGEFLKMYGDENNRAYSESIRQINNDYARTLMSYGKNAEMLANNGLSSSGVSDYGDHAAYAARQGAVTAAQDRLTQENKADMAEYQNYLAQQNREANQAKNARVNLLLQAMQSGVSDENTAMAIAAGSGLFSSDEEYTAFAEAIKNYGQSVNTTANNSEALFANTQTAFDELVSNGYTAEQAKSLLMQWAEKMPSQYDSNVIDEIYNKHIEIKGMLPPTTLGGVEISDEERVAIEAAFNDYAEKFGVESAAELINQNYSQYTDADGKGIGTVLLETYNGNTDIVYGYQVKNMLSENYSPFGENQYTVSSIKALINNKEVSEEEGNAMIADIQNKNANLFSTYMDAAHDNASGGMSLKQICSLLGVAYDKENEEASAEEAIKILRNRAEEFYYNGEISEELYEQILQKDFQYEVEVALDDNYALRNLCSSIVNFSNYTDEMQNNGKEAYTKMIEHAIQEGKISFGVTNFQNTTTFAIDVKGKNGIKTTTFNIKPLIEQKVFQVSEEIIAEYTVRKNSKSPLNTISVLKCGEICYTFERDGKLFAYKIDLDKESGYSGDMLNVVIDLIGNLIVNQK